MKNTFLPVLLALVVGGALIAFFVFHKGGGGIFEYPLSFFGNASSTPNAGNVTAADPQLFTETSLGFSLKLPNGYKAQKILNDSGETILIQNGKGDQGFQVVITPFSDSGSSITKARIQKEAGLKITNDAPLMVGGAAQGLEFDNNSSSPPLRDAWFVYNGYLYQAQTWKSDATLLDTILSSWQFK